MELLLIGAGASIISGILPSAIQTVSKYFKVKKKDSSNLKTQKSFEDIEQIRIIEDQLLLSIEQCLNESNYVFKEIVQDYDLKQLISPAKYIFTQNYNKDMNTSVKNKIEEIINNYHFEKIAHFNILLLGDNPINNNSLIKSMTELYNLKNEPRINSEKCEESEKFISYKGKDLWLMDYKEKDNKQINIEKIKQLIDEETYDNKQDKFIHCIWYFLKEEQLLKSDEENIKKLIEYFGNILPIIVLFKENFYSSDDSEDIIEEIKKQINEGVGEDKEIDIFKLSSDNDSTIILKKEDRNNFGIKGEIKNLVNISKKRVEISLNSSRFYSYILTNIYKNENNKIYSKIKISIEERTNFFLSGNTINNMHLLNKQIINKIIKKLLNIQKIDSKAKKMIKDLFIDFEKFLLNKCKNHFVNAFGNCNYNEILKFIQNLDEKEEKDDLEIEKEILKFLKKPNVDKKNDKKDKVANETQLIDKIDIVYKNIVIKHSSYFIDSKLIEELIKLLNESFSNQIKDFNTIIKNKLKNA